MTRKILILMLVISLIIVPNIRNNPEAHANPILKEAVKIVVKQAIKKETKSAVESQLIKSGVRTVEKKALERANERWFQRLAADEVASLTKAVERATPASTPGYLKVIVGAAMFASGADLAFDIYDALSAEKEVDYFTDENINLTQDGTARVKGVYGYDLTYVYDRCDSNYVPCVRQSKPFLRDRVTGNYVSPDRSGGVVTKVYDGAIPYYYLRVDGPQYSPTMGNRMRVSLVTDYNFSINSRTGEISDFRPLGRTYTADHFYLPMSSVNDDDGYYYGRDSLGKFDYDTAAKAQPQRYPMPSDMADIWPGEKEVVEIIFPDPDFFPDTTQTIIDNPQIVTNPIPEPQPTPEPSPSIEPTTSPAPSPSVGPTGQPNPSAEPTLSPSSTPAPSVAPSSQPTVPPVIGGEDPIPTTPPGEEDDDDDYDGPVIDSPLTPEEALAIGWEDVTPPLIKEYKDPKTGTIVKFNTKTGEIIYTKYFGVDIVNSGGKKLGEIDEIDMENEIFYEDKSAKGLSTINPTTGLPSLTPQQWADKQIRDKTRVRINSALKEGTATRPTPEGSKIVPDIELFRNYREFIFRMEADSLELRQATENALNDLRQEFPDYKFSATFGGGI